DGIRDYKVTGVQTCALPISLLLGEVIQQAELPPGVVNILTGAGATGASLVGHPDVDKVAFTGSTEVGKQIRRAVAGSSKHLTLRSEERRVGKERRSRGAPGQ